MRAVIAEAYRVTVWRRSGYATSSDAPTSSRYIFDDNGLTEPSPHGFGHDAPNYVIPAARRESNDQCDGSCRVGLRRCLGPAIHVYNVSV
jgi:hypothetical protein